jgi:hypothetical protein
VLHGPLTTHRVGSSCIRNAVIRWTKTVETLEGSRDTNACDIAEMDQLPAPKWPPLLAKAASQPGRGQPNSTLSEEKNSLPPRSDPTPRGEPLIASSAPSPPELPPQVSSRLYGLIVVPKTLLTVSASIRACKKRHSELNRVRRDKRPAKTNLRDVGAHKEDRLSIQIVRISAFDDKTDQEEEDLRLAPAKCRLERHSRR